jgi:hypothetical protein
LTNRPTGGMNGDVPKTKRTNQADRMKADLERIAREVLSVEILETRNSDSLDFSDQAVWTLRRALEAAYQAGFQAVR